MSANNMSIPSTSAGTSRATRIASVVAATMLLALPAGAQTTGVGPSASYTQPNWTDPATGCSYSRAQAQGYAPTWHLLINGSRIGLTDAHRGCAAWLRSG